MRGPILSPVPGTWTAFCRHFDRSSEHVVSSSIAEVRLLSSSLLGPVTRRTGPLGPCGSIAYSHRADSGADDRERQHRPAALLLILSARCCFLRRVDLTWNR